MAPTSTAAILPNVRHLIPARHAAQSGITAARDGGLLDSTPMRRIARPPVWARTGKTAPSVAAPAKIFASSSATSSEHSARTPALRYHTEVSSGAHDFETD